MGILWTILIGFIAGIIAKFVTPGKNEPQGFILTTVLGIVGAFVDNLSGSSRRLVSSRRRRGLDWRHRRGRDCAPDLGRLHPWSHDGHLRKWRAFAS